MSKVVRIRRGWSYRIIYEVRHRRVHVNAIVPTWFIQRRDKSESD
jgi:hypothetical protein